MPFAIISLHCLEFPRRPSIDSTALRFLQRTTGELAKAEWIEEVNHTSAIKIAPPNSLLFISASDIADAPELVLGVPILSTSSCISVGCLMWQDGETDVMLGAAAEVGPQHAPAFDSQLDTPNRRVIISKVYSEIALTEPICNTRTRVRIWVNRLPGSDRIIVGLN
jgi:hypothetical protein